MNVLKKYLRSFLRFLLGIRDNETIADGVDRIKYKFLKKLPHKKISLHEFEIMISKLGICSGDTLIVHSSWRAMYMLNASPDDVIDVLLKQIGINGTLLMPCYGSDSSYFDVQNTKSAAGVLSECLRLRKDSFRSCFPKFSMCAVGKNAETLISTHRNSLYQFDSLSPYSIAVKKYNAKILFLGMGKSPHKVSVFHLASYEAREKVAFYKECYSKEACSTVFDGKKEMKISYIDRAPKYQNDKRTFVALLSKTPKLQLSKNNLNIMCFYSQSALDVASVFCMSGGKIYKC